MCCFYLFLNAKSGMMEAPKKIVKAERAFHKGENRLMLLFDYDKVLIELVKKLPGISWSKTLNAWHIADTKDDFNRAYLLFKGNVWFDYSALQKPVLAKAVEAEKKKFDWQAVPDLSDDKKQSVVYFEQWLNAKRYSGSTVKTYTNAIVVFLRYFNDKTLEVIDNNDLILFNNQFILASGYSSSYQNQMVNAIKLFFSQVKDRKLNPELIHRPKAEKTLPNVLSKEEVKKILQASPNVKHKAMLSLIYACGLRCGEVLSLKKEHVDSKRNLLIIKQGKGKKDRIVPLSNKTIEMLRGYYVTFKPVVYLFEGEQASTKYSSRSLQQVLKQCLVKAKISKPVTLHWLRHSYATHLLEAGTDLRYIQEILGHKSSTTTEIYTHVSNRSIQKINSPFDDL